MVQHIEGHWQKVISGAWVEELSLEVTGNGIPTITASGGFSRVGWCYRDVIGAAGIATGASSCPLGDASRGCVGVGAVVSFGTDTNTAVGYTVTEVDNSAGSAHFHFTPVLAGAGSAGGQEIKPLVPAQTVGGNILSAVDCLLTIGSITPGFVSCKLNYSTGIGPRDKEATLDRCAGLMRVAPRVVEMDTEMYFLDTNAGNGALQGFAHDGTTYAVTLRVGSNTAAYRLSVGLPKARVDISTQEVPEADVVMANMKVIARQSAAACDELTFTFN
jgi:hypothetical protein